MTREFSRLGGIALFLFTIFAATGASSTSVSVAYVYDRLGRLQSATYGDGTVIVYCYDWNGNRNQYTVSTTLTACSTNHWPVAVPDNATTVLSTAVTFDPRVNDTDADGDALTITAKTDGAHGTVAINSGTSVTYTPTTGYVGSDTFTYTIDDGHGGTAVGTDTVVVTAGVTPNPIMWDPIDAFVSSGPVSGSNSPQTFSGIVTTITIKLALAPGSLGGAQKYSRNGGALTTWTSGATLTVVAGDTLYFSVSRAGTGISMGAIQVINQSDSNALVNQFDYDVESGSP